MMTEFVDAKAEFDRLAEAHARLFAKPPGVIREIGDAKMALEALGNKAEALKAELEESEADIQKLSECFNEAMTIIKKIMGPSA